MSLERTALRIATQMALTDAYRPATDQTKPWPTIAASRVYDSRIDPIDDGFDPGSLYPMILLHTDSDEGKSLSANNGGPPFERTVRLMLQLSLGIVGETEEGVSWHLPATEPELEATLDLFEAQVERVLLDPTNRWVDLLSKSYIRISSWQSERYTDRESMVRMAARQITATVDLPLVADPSIVTAAPVGNGTIAAPLGPLLEAIIDDGGAAADDMEALRDKLLDAGAGRPIVIPGTLQTIRIKEANLGGGNTSGTGSARAAGVAQITTPT